MAMLHGCAAQANKEPSWGLTLLHLDGANGATAIVDESGKPFTRTGTPVITTADSKFGGASLDFQITGNNRYMISNGAYSNDLVTGLGPLTLECFFKFYAATGFTVQGLVGIGSTSAGGCLNLHRGGTYGTKDAICMMNSSINTTFLDSGISHADGNWHHVAVCRDTDGLWTMWVDGVRVATATTVIDFTNQGAAMTLGNVQPAVNGYSYRGLLDEVRYINNKAMYSGATITVPTAPFAYAKP